jgi:hypothetical protein
MKVIIRRLTGGETELTVKNDDTICQLHSKYYKLQMN